MIRQAINFYRARQAWLGEGGLPVPANQAQERADTCLKCPKHERMGIYEGVTSPIARMTRQQIAVKNRLNLHLEGEEGLHICSACDCVLLLKCWIPLKFVLETTLLEKLNQENPRCWILTEFETKGAP